MHTVPLALLFAALLFITITTIPNQVASDRTTDIITSTQPTGIIITSNQTISTVCVPVEWRCDNSHYNTTDGCDCNCGAYDPDCDISQRQLFGCHPNGIGCSKEGDCLFPPGLPATWTCFASNYNASDGCDCKCGAWDPDCDADNRQSKQCKASVEMCVRPGICERIPMPPKPLPPPSWTCGVEYYNNSDGCDCNCGAYDPDCDRKGQMFNCPCPRDSKVTCNSLGFCVGQCGPIFLTADVVAPVQANWDRILLIVILCQGVLFVVVLLVIGIVLWRRSARRNSEEKKKAEVEQNVVLLSNEATFE